VVREAWEVREQAGVPHVPALLEACDALLSGEFAALALTRAHAAEMRELWLMQPRFEKRVGKYPYRLIAQPRYRAAWDFLALRAQAGEVPEALVAWWDQFAHAGEEERLRLIRAAEGKEGGSPGAKKKRRRRKKARNAAAPAAAEDREQPAALSEGGDT